MARDDAAAGDEIGFQFTAMASPCELRLLGLPLAEAQRLAGLALAEVRRIEARYSRYRADSVISRINAAAGLPGAVAVDAETEQLLGFGAQLHALSGGRFDLSSGVLRRAWDFKAGRLPAPGQLEALLPLVGWPQVEWQGDGRLRLPQAGMELDFGGIGKEYAADRAATLLQREGAASGMVNLGGDIRLLGPRPGGQAWQLGIAHPRQASAMLGQMSLHDGALATSGDYERYFEHDGRRYCHLLDPRTGWPVQGWQSVSVLAPACLAAGALCTVAMLQGLGLQDFLDRQAVDYLAVDASGQVVQRGPHFSTPSQGSP